MGLSFFDTHAWLATRDDVERLEELVVQPLPARRKQFLHRERDPHVGRLAHCGAEEFRRSNADDRVDSGSDAHFLANDRWIAAEPPFPPGIAGHSDRTAARNLIIILDEGA